MIAFFGELRPAINAIVVRGQAALVQCSRRRTAMPQKKCGLLEQNLVLLLSSGVHLLGLPNFVQMWCNLVA